MNHNYNNPCDHELVYKFRALDTIENFERIKVMITTGAFWFSSLWNQNDSLEGVYLTNNEEEDLFKEKNNVKICCFSRKKALAEPLMWAHYAGGFKGIAIGVQLYCNHCRIPAFKNVNVEYINEFDADEKIDFEKIITRKTKIWEYENEMRVWINQEKDGHVAVGTVKELHYFEPYKNVSNHEQVHDQSSRIKEYIEMLKELKEYCKQQRPDIPFTAHKYKNLKLTNSTAGNNQQ